MNREDIIRMAREAGLVDNDFEPSEWCVHEYMAFAALVASAEANACIVDIQWHMPRSGRGTPEYQMAMRMIERIRARKSRSE